MREKKVLFYLIFILTFIFTFIPGIALADSDHDHNENLKFKLQDSSEFKSDKDFIYTHYENQEFPVYVFVVSQNDKEPERDHNNIKASITLSGKKDNKDYTWNTSVIIPPGSAYAAVPIVCPDAGNWQLRAQEMVDNNNDKQISGETVLNFTVESTEPNPSDSYIKIQPSEPPSALIIPTTGTKQFEAWFYTKFLCFEISFPVTDISDWSSQKPDIATVDNANNRGAIKGIAEGQTQITATFSFLCSYSDTVTVTVVKPTITVTPTSASMYTGDTASFQATATYAGITEDVTNSADWNSSNPSIATIGTKNNAGTTPGLATGVSAGLSQITATAYGITSPPAALTVVDPLTITPSSASIVVGATQSFKAELISDHTDVTQLASWSSDSTAVTITASGKEGDPVLVTASTAGTYTITAKYGQHTATATLKVVKPPTLSIRPDNASITIGGKQQYTAEYSDDTTPNPIDVTTAVTWTSSNGHASIDQTGLATGVTNGECIISATYKGVSDQVTLTVNSPTLTIVPASVSITVGETYTFTLQYSDGYVPRTIEWSSSNTQLAPVDQTGKVSGRGGGTFLITARDPDTGVTGTAQVIVTAPVTPPNIPPEWGPNWRLEGPY